MHRSASSFLRITPLERKCHCIFVELFHDPDELFQTFTVIFFMSAENAGKRFFAVEWYPCELAAVVIQKTRSQANASSCCDVSKGGVVVCAVEVTYLSAAYKAMLHGS